MENRFAFGPQSRTGDTVIIRDGVYRECVVVATSGTEQRPIRFQAAPGAHVVLTGADRLTDWKRMDGDKPIYYVHWPYRFVTWSRQMTHPDDPYHRVVGRCEQVVIDGYLLRQVLEPAQLAPGAFFVDITNQTLSVWDIGSRDLNKLAIEASARQEIFRVEGDYVDLRGLHFRFAANMAQHGAVALRGNHDSMTDCIVEAMNASGATFAGENQVVQRCTFRDNGQLGFGAHGAHGLLFSDCLVENNNSKGFDRGWEAGGDKLVLCRNAVLLRSRFLRNHGNGIWFDIGNEDCTVEQCLIAENDDAGIFQEISFSLHAHDNVIVGNGFASTSGAWGAQAGISLSSSPEAVVERNLIVGNREGFDFREQSRSTPRIGKKGAVPVWNHDETVRWNVIAFNRDAQIWGWFDINDNRHWPANRASSSAEQQDHRATDEEVGEHQAERRTLEKLRLAFIENTYWAEPGQGWFNWGVTWKRHENYPTLARFRADLQIDRGSRALRPDFAGINALDFRLSQQAMEEMVECYPRGPVPDVTLGVLP